MTGDTMADPSAPYFHPILTDAGNGPSFTMLGTTMRLIATAANTGRRFAVGEQVTPPVWDPLLLGELQADLDQRFMAWQRLVLPQKKIVASVKVSRAE